MSALKHASVATFIAFAFVALVYYCTRPVPHCKIVNGREINDHHCIPYCPPDPKECS